VRTEPPRLVSAPIKVFLESYGKPDGAPIDVYGDTNSFEMGIDISVLEIGAMQLVQGDWWVPDCLPGISLVLKGVLKDTAWVGGTEELHFMDAKPVPNPENCDISLFMSTKSAHILVQEITAALNREQN